MNGRTLFNGSGGYVELRQGTLQALEGERGLELPLERGVDGRLTAACKAQVAARLQEFFRRAPWQPRPRVLCAIGARGVSLRRLTLPAAARDDLQRVLLLQVESEFPMSPADLAWGYRILGEAGKNNSNGGRQEILVAAVKKEAVEEYAELFSNCGVTPLFTVAALARSRLCPQPPAAYAVLDVGRYASELVCFENGVPAAVRLVAWGGETVTRALSEQLQLGRNEAEAFKMKLETAPRHDGDIGPKVELALEAAVAELAGALEGHSMGRKLYLTGKSSRQKDLATRLARRLGHGMGCQTVEVAAQAGRTAAILGLQQLSLGGEAPLVLQSKPANGYAVVARPTPWKWVGIAAALLCATLAVPYGEAFVFRSHLAHKVAEVKREAAGLGVIDRDLNFLEYLKQSQPPYLDTLYLFAKAAPPGARLESFNMNRRGELSWRGTLKDSQQVAEFRSKLIDSGMLANVTVEEQTPSQDRQKLSVRMSAHWKSLSPKQAVALGPTAEEIEKARTNVHQPVFGAPMMPGGFPGMPGEMPPGISMPARRSSRGSVMPGTGMPGNGAQVMPGTSMPGMPSGVHLPPGVNRPAGENPPGGQNP